MHVESCSLNPHYETVLAAANAACAGQDHPAGCLYVLATPIGNLADIGLRTLHLLQVADLLACEDTRHSQSLLRNYGLDKPHGAWMALHQHNENSAAEQVILRLQQGQRVVYLSDAGTPAVSDPGARLVALVHAAGLRVMPVPGASSVTTVLSASGCGEDGQCVFLGFLSSKASERHAAVQAMACEPRAQVFLEAPHRIEALANALEVLGQRPLTIGREMTKQFEEIALLPAGGFSAWLKASAQRSKGEFALVLHPMPQASSRMGDAERVLDLLLAELPVKTAVKLAAEISGAPRNRLYELALQKTAVKD